MYIVQSITCTYYIRIKQPKNKNICKYTASSSKNKHLEKLVGIHLGFP